MEADVQRKLLDINRSFYERFARPFADSRSAAQESLRRIVALVRPGDAVLDVGCGDGRVARALAGQQLAVSYSGVDSSAPLIRLARERSVDLSPVQAGFAQADVADENWDAPLAARRFDVILSLAVLHHLPGIALRQRVLRQMAAHLSPGGRLVISTWQFMSSERLRKKIVPWAAIGLDDRQVDPGDYLLDWQRGGYGLRYLHLVAEDELRGLVEGAGLAVRSVFLADRDLNLFVIAEMLAHPGTTVL